MSRTNTRHPQRKSRKPNVARMSREALVAALDATKPEWTPFVEGDIGPSSAESRRCPTDNPTLHQIKLQRPLRPRLARLATNQKRDNIAKLGSG